jgi:eukaryotic-like serine/threonine-protein kinase
MAGLFRFPKLLDLVVYSRGSMLAEPTRLGPYEILAPLGAGGMGVVYRARDPRLEREVAIKILPQHLSQSPQALARFIRETKAIAALSHPNILAIFDTGVADGITYAVTELLEGESLRAGIRRGPFAWRRAVEIGIALAEGLSAAHAKGITHRDLKPENIFVMEDGRTKILDFGLARIEVIQMSADAETETAAGTLLGTPAYMSPEQVRGSRAGPVSDIFSLGCVLYEMISGMRAFPGESAPEIMSAILRDTPREPVAREADLPADLIRLVFSCLDKNCDERLQSARAVGVSLKAMLSFPGVPSQAHHPADSIAVLPFGKENNDADSDYLCDGITESILNSLAGIRQLRVTPRSTVFRYKGREVDPQIIGRELNVRLVLIGRIIQRGETLVASAELVDVVAGCQLWGERFRRKISDIFALEEEIARRISESLRMKLGGEQKPLVRRSTENTEAYQDYLRGRHHWTKRTPDRLRMAADYFQKAIEKDPGYALAYSGLADCYSILGIYSILPSKDALSKAKAAAAAAVAFDDEMAEGHTSLGFVKAYLDWNWFSAEKEFQRALELNRYWVTHYWYGILLTSSGRYEQAEEQIRCGIELEPLSPVVLHGAAWNALALHRFKVSIERCMRGLESDPDSFLLRFWLGMVYEMQAKHQEAIQEFQTAVDLCAAGVSYIVGGLGHAHATAGNRLEAFRIIEELLERAKREPVDLIAVAVIYAGLAEAEQALTYLEKAADARGMSGLLVNADPRYDTLRSDPRFQELLKRMNLR